MNSNGYVRITSIVLVNFKNVSYGKVESYDDTLDSSGSISGIFGQNGSGKTAVIDAIAILGDVLKGKALDLNVVDYINVESDHAGLQFSFELKDGRESWNALYEFKICRQSIAGNFKPGIYDEKLSLSYSGNTVESGQFAGNEISLDAERMRALNESMSFIFSDTAYEVLQVNEVDSSEYRIYMRLLRRLRYFGESELFIITSRSSIDALPLFLDDGMKVRSTRCLMISMNGADEVRSDIMPILSRQVVDLNLVLSEMIPGMAVEIKDYGLAEDVNGEEMVGFELMSSRNGKNIPLRCESEGIRKIISILPLLIRVYNTASITVAIDDLDSRIFEYLLGELLMILSEEAEGQFIFTSLDLRPLETMNNGNLIFTTSDPADGYMKLVKGQEYDNLREQVYRGIYMNNMKNCIYQSISNVRMSGAFIDAGAISDLAVRKDCEASHVMEEGI